MIDEECRDIFGAMTRSSAWIVVIGVGTGPQPEDCGDTIKVLAGELQCFQRILDCRGLVMS